MQKIPVYLVTGFLGSGKTTFIQRAIEYFTGKAKIGIVQNEFAPANVDGKVLKRVTNQDFDLLEINNGSAFCVCLLSDFITSLEKFVLRYNPDLLLIETSGLSDIISVGEVFNSGNLQELIYLSGTFGIVDAVHYMKIKDLMPRVKRQLMIADHLFINKTDLNQNTAIIKKYLNEINPFARKYFTVYCKADFIDIFQPFPHPSWEKLPVFVVDTEINNRPDVHSVVYRTVRPALNEKFKEFINEIASKSYRVKGIVYTNNGKCFTVQAVFGHVEYKEITTSELKTELIVIGKEMDAKNLRIIFKRYSTNSNL